MPKEPIPPVELLIEQLHGPDWTARCDAARPVGQSRDPHAVEALLLDLDDRDWRVRRNAAQALKDRTLTVRQRAIVALERIKDPRALPSLLDIVMENKQESYEASKAVRKVGKKALPATAQAFEKSRLSRLPDDHGPQNTGRHGLEVRRHVRGCQRCQP